MKENILDRRTEKIKERLSRVFAKLSEQYKGTNPYRQEPVPPKESLLDFAQMTDEDIMFGREQFGDEAIDQYMAQMSELLRRQK